MSLEPGQNLAHYRLLEKIGEGGMGVVWKAQDTQLQREVAVKILPEAFAREAERLARFEREAKMLAALNHPHIAAVYGLHEYHGQRFLAMELVPGEDLAVRLARGPLPVAEALALALQISAALEAAHAQGVIHRDLKPANIRLTTNGSVKVLDFGLAKALDETSTSGSLSPSLSPTLTAGTAAGVILGTAAYMSPEQARGHPADRRADIWSLGAVLYEMLSGRRAFQGETISDTMAAVLKVEPDWQALPRETPPEILRLLHTCLMKDRERRLPHISAVRFELQQSHEGRRDAGLVHEPPARLPALAARLLPWGLVVLLTAVTLAAFLFPGSGTSPQALHLAVPLPAGTSLRLSQMGLMDLSADGRQVALVLTDTQGQRLYLETLDNGKIVPLDGTEQAVSPFFSPDGRWLGFFAGGKLKKVSTQGGRPFTICDTPGNNRGASWGEDGRIIFAAHYTEALKQVPAAGGTPEPFTHLDEKQGERTHRWPQVVPGEDLVLFTVGTMDSPESYDAAHIDAVRPSTGLRKTILQGASMARYLPTGHLLFAREGFLFAVPFDTRQLTTSGTPVPVLENVKTVKASGLARAVFSSTGTLIYVQGGAEDLRTRLVWRFLDGHSELLDAPMDEYNDVALSPDGSRLAVAIRGDTVFDIWIQNIQAGGLTRLTFEGDNSTPVWTPDGQGIAFSSVRHNKLASVYIKAADGTGEAELLYDPESSPGSGGANPESWSPDGLWLAIASNNLNGYNISLFSTEDGTEKPFLQEKSAELFAAFSPDGRWMAYASDESGRTEVYVRPFPGPGGKRQISRQGGLEPYWSRDGKSLFFRNATTLYRVDVDTGTGFRAGNPEQVLDGLPDVGQALVRLYTLHPDGRRLLTLETRTGRSEGTSQVNFVSHWFDEIKTKLSHD